MNRRSAIKNFVVFSAGVVLLPACLQEEKKLSVKPDNLKLDGNQENLLAELAETIIPKTTSPGAKDISAHTFALTMVDDCYTQEERDKFVKGLKGFEELVQKRFSKSFVALNAEQRSVLLSAIEAKKDIPDEVASFYGSMKRLTVQSFTTSKYYLTEVRKYEMAPGRYKGCVPVTASSTSN